MLGKITCNNFVDEHENPAGGSVEGVGIKIQWQDGPLGRGEERKEPNGAFVETVIYAALQRLEWYQESRFSCIENQKAIEGLQSALDCLDSRTKRRESAKTEGLHQGN